MKIKRITQMVSLVMILLLLVSVFPLTGAVSAVAAETEPAAETAPSEVTETVEASEPPKATQAPEEEPDAPELSTEPAPETEAATEEETEPTEEASAEEIPEPEDFQKEPQDFSDLNSDTQAIRPAPDLLEAATAKMWVPFNIWGSSASTLRISFQYPNDPSNTTYSTAITGMKIHYMNDKVAYCLEPQASSTAGDVYSEIAGGDSLNVWELYLSDAQRKAISLVLAYGAPNKINSTNDLTRHGYEVATQVIIWEIIVGDRSTVKPYTRTNARLFNFFDPLMTPNDSTGVLKSAFENAYTSITSDMAQHGNIPSFASALISAAPTHTMTYNSSTGLYTLTLTDTNNAINNDFPYINGNGLTFSKSGNKLTITATRAALQNGPVMVASTGSDPDVDSIAPVIWGTSRSNHKVGQILCQMASPDPVKAYFKLEAEEDHGTMTIKKVSDDLDDVEGYCFKLYRSSPSGNSPARSRWGKSDANGNVFEVYTDNYTENGSRVYTFDDLIDGTYIFMEALSKKGAGLVWPESIRFTVTNNGSTVFDQTYTGDQIIRTATGDASIRNLQLTGLTGGGNLTITVKNEPVRLPIHIYKEWTDGNPSNLTASFLVEEFVPDAGIWWERGTVTITEGSMIDTMPIAVGAKLRITETSIAEGYRCLSENPQIIPYVDEDHCSVSFKNAPLVKGSLTIVKVDRGTRDKLEGAGFRLYDAAGSVVGEAYTDFTGRVEFHDLPIGNYEYQEFQAPVGYVLDETRYPFSVTAENPEIEVERENDIREGSIRVRKIDEKGQPMAGVAFLLEYSLNDGMSWLPVGYRDFDDPVRIGCSTNDEAIEGVTLTGTDGWAEFAGLAVNNQLCNIMYRLTEVKTKDGYQLLTEPVFEGYLTTELTEIERTAVNHPTFQMPMTGSTGFAGAGIGLGLCLLASVLLLLFLPKKREDMNNG